MATRFREWRKARKIGQKPLARALGGAQSKISDLENNKAHFDDALLACLADGYGLNVNWLLTGVGRPDAIDTEARIVVIEPPPSDDGAVAEAVVKYGERTEYIPIRLLRNFTVLSPGKLIKKRDIIAWIVVRRDWCRHPESTVAVHLPADTLTSSIPPGALVTIDRAETAPAKLIGDIVIIHRVGPKKLILVRLADDGDNGYIGIPDNQTKKNTVFRLTPRDTIIGRIETIQAHMGD